MQVGQGERAQSREVTFGDGSWKEMPAGGGLVQTVGTYPCSYPCAVHGRWAEWLHLCSALLCTCGALTRPEGLDMEEPRQKKVKTRQLPPGPVYLPFSPADRPHEPPPASQLTTSRHQSLQLSD